MSDIIKERTIWISDSRNKDHHLSNNWVDRYKHIDVRISRKVSFRLSEECCRCNIAVRSPHFCGAKEHTRAREGQITKVMKKVAKEANCSTLSPSPPPLPGSTCIMTVHAALRSRREECRAITAGGPPRRYFAAAACTSNDLSGI